MKKNLIILVAVLSIVVIMARYAKMVRWGFFEMSEVVEEQREASPKGESEGKVIEFSTRYPEQYSERHPESSEGSPSILPFFYDTSMQFYPQAPYANWNLPYQEACEEAAALLAVNFFQERTVTKEEFNQQILDLVAFEKKRFGYYEHTTVEETKTFIQEYLQYPHVEIMEQPSIEDIKRVLVDGKLVIAPLAGQLLENPFFTPPPPVYHFVVIKGYDETHFITHDVGTRRGAGYRYPYNVIMNAIHDWAEGITEGESRVLILGEVKG